MGIRLKKEWMATLDGRTRHEHRELDGQVVEVDEPFRVDGQEIEFPGDPKAQARLVYNCRCTMVAALDGVRDDQPRVSYREWEKMKKVRDESVPQSKSTDNSGRPNKPWTEESALQY